MPFRPFIDRSSTVALGVQLKGQVEYAIACGDLAPGTRLPTVRRLAERLGVSPVTVSQVYRELQKAGLLVARTGRGTYVTESIGVPVGDPRDRHLEALLDHVIVEGRRLGLDDDQLVGRLADHLVGSEPRGREVTVLVVGMFEAATQAYAEALQGGLAGLARVRGATFDELSVDTITAEAGIDLVVTFPYRVAEVRARLGEAVPVTYLRFVPSEPTRVSLAHIDPRQRLLGVARLPAFLPALEAGIARYAPHVSSIAYCLATDPHLPSLLSRSDVVVYASGAEAVRSLLGDHERAFEYRHAPDPVFVETHLLPIVRALRSGRPLPQAPPPGEGSDPSD
jgi:DNA-binding transcriptional regulator YhcF (GntR family)